MVDNQELAQYIVNIDKELRDIKGQLKGMTKEQKDKIFKILVGERNDYVRACNIRVAEERGKIAGADYMLQRFLDILKIDEYKSESE